MSGNVITLFSNCRALHRVSSFTLVLAPTRIGVYYHHHLQGA